MNTKRGLFVYFGKVQEQFYFLLLHVATKAHSISTLY